MCPEGNALALVQLEKKTPRMNNLDLNDVRTFVGVAQAGTLTAAAKEMRHPASTLSRALTRLEKLLGALLMQRSPRGLSLTDSGKGKFREMLAPSL
jgi:molybdenum-dependent DNA-binding transcriptional regulator ModE